ncbi:hypothetical protein D3C83_273610 [compost metagenome]
MGCAISGLQLKGLLAGANSFVCVPTGEGNFCQRNPIQQAGLLFNFQHRFPLVESLRMLLAVLQRTGQVAA